MVSIKSEREIELMREAGRILARVHEELEHALKPGMSTLDVDRLGEKIIRGYGCIPSFKNYNGYPASICVSVNDEVVHGIPNKHHYLKEGDIVSLDAGVIYKGYHSDAARTHGIGQISPEAQKLIDVTQQSFWEGIKLARKGFRVSDIGHAVQEYVEANGFSVVRDFVGHGVGAKLHEPPEVRNFGPAGHGPRLLPGMTLAVEPMVCAGDWQVKVLADKWTTVSLDGSLTAHYENSILITDGEPEILTVTEDGAYV